MPLHGGAGRHSAADPPRRVPDKPFAPTVKQFDHASVMLEWKARREFSWYGAPDKHQLQWRRSDSKEWQTARVLLSANACLKKNLESGVEYSFRVRGKNGAAVEGV